ncbi:MAG: TspO/MBR family protein [Defluviimonas denitrificans]
MFGGQFPIFLAACGAAAATGVMFPPGRWYDTLKKPGWTPPRWAFPVAWTTLYLLIALAAARVAGLAGSGTALALWSLQIALNTLWTPVFFGAHRIGAGAFIIGLLWLTVLAMIPVFWALDTWAGMLLLPYLVWLSLAAALNLWIWRNNAE